MKVFVTLCFFFVAIALVIAAPEGLKLEEDNLMDPSENKVEDLIESARTVMLAAFDSLEETETAATKENERCGGRLNPCPAPEEKARCGGRLNPCPATEEIARCRGRLNCH